MHDVIEKAILNIFEEVGEVLETKEVLERVKVSLDDITRTKLFYRLNLLRGEGLIYGKFVGPGKGVWIWWAKDAFPEKQTTIGEFLEAKNDK
jgi:hypothetical protein